MIRIDDFGDIEIVLLERNLLEEIVLVFVNLNGEIDVELQVVVVGEVEEVSGGVFLVDVLLIGVLFRFVLFVVRYVSGVDLVEKKQFL